MWTFLCKRPLNVPVHNTIYKSEHRRWVTTVLLFYTYSCTDPTNRQVIHFSLSFTRCTIADISFGALCKITYSATISQVLRKERPKGPAHNVATSRWKQILSLQILSLSPDRVISVWVYALCLCYFVGSYNPSRRCTRNPPHALCLRCPRAEVLMLNCRQPLRLVCATGRYEETSVENYHKYWWQFGISWPMCPSISDFMKWNVRRESGYSGVTEVLYSWSIEWCIKWPRQVK